VSGEAATSDVGSVVQPIRSQNTLSTVGKVDSGADVRGNDACRGSQLEYFVAVVRKGRVGDLGYQITRS
jgi:hypothetical protein